MSAEGITQTPECGECDAIWLPADEDRWRRIGSTTAPTRSSSSIGAGAASASSACSERTRTRDRNADLADPYPRRPLLEGHTGDDQDHDLRQRLDGDDPPALELHVSAQARPARRLTVRRHEPGALRGGPPDLTRARRGAAPLRSKKNLWPQPWPQARREDHGIEARLHRRVCNGTLTLRQARLQEVAYKHKYG
jgi:hypothetical protein